MNYKTIYTDTCDDVIVLYTHTHVCGHANGVCVCACTGLYIYIYAYLRVVCCSTFSLCLSHVSFMLINTHTGIYVHVCVCQEMVRERESTRLYGHIKLRVLVLTTTTTKQILFASFVIVVADENVCVQFMLLFLLFALLYRGMPYHMTTKHICKQQYGNFPVLFIIIAIKR